MSLMMERYMMRAGLSTSHSQELRKIVEAEVTQIGQARLKKKHPYLSGMKWHSEAPHDQAIAKAKDLRDKGQHASIFHVSGPKTGPKSVYAVATGDRK